MNERVIHMYVDPSQWNMQTLMIYFTYSVVLQGDYKAHATITDTATSEEVACYDLQVSTEADCTGFACLIG